MILDETVSWYESGLPTHERKSRGHFSTPPLLVEQILDACGYTSAHDLAQIRVLDPACGSGNFLAGVTRRLLAFADGNKLDVNRHLSLIRRNLWGFDPDPIACFLAEMQLRTILADEASLNGKRVPPLHIHQADCLAFPWEQSQPVDLFLANPPYLAAKNNDLSGYRSVWQHGQADSYLLFLDLALRIVRPGGWIGLVLPDPVLARANASHGRRLLLQETTVHHLWHLAGVFPAYVGAAVLIAQKSPPPQMHQVTWMRGRWQRDVALEVVPDPIVPVHASTISQASLYHQHGAAMRYLLSDAYSTQHLLVKRLHEFLCEQPIELTAGAWFTPARETPRAGVNHAPAVNHDNPVFVPLGDLVLIRRGEELSKKHAVLVSEPLSDGEGCYPVLRGGVDIRAYEKPVGRYWMKRTGIQKKLERYLQPKLLVVKSTGILQATLDLNGHVVLQTLYMLLLRTEKKSNQADELYFLLALLNSRLLRTYVHVLYTAYKWVQPQIEQHVLVHLPIPTLQGPEREQIVARAKILMDACGESPIGVELKQQEIYEEQERAICALYQAVLAEGRASGPFSKFLDKGVSYG